jgi:hypothetical protein
MKTFTELLFILTMLSNGRCQEICRSSDHGCPIEFSVYRYPDMNSIRARRRSDDRMVRPAMRPYSFLGQMNWSMTDTGTWREGPTMIVGANIPTDLCRDGETPNHLRVSLLSYNDPCHLALKTMP